MGVFIFNSKKNKKKFDLSLDKWFIICYNIEVVWDNIRNFKKNKKKFEISLDKWFVLCYNNNIPYKRYYIDKLINGIISCIGNSVNKVLPVLWEVNWMELNCKGYFTSMLFLVSDSKDREENSQSKVYCASIYRV